MPSPLINPATPEPTLVLASTSPYRKALLKRLNLPFQTIHPQINEQQLDAETAEQAVKRLAEAKARAAGQQLQHQQPQPLGTRQSYLIIGSDQLSVSAGKVLGKPETYAAATRQLRQASGQCVQFVTGIAVLNCTTGNMLSSVAHNQVWFRDLTDTQIETYLAVEKPLDCAGSFKSEGLGIALFRRIEGDDPNALIGLPLICLCGLLHAQGLDVLA